MLTLESQPQRESKRQLSLERKLTFQELGRRFWLLIGTDILIILLFLALSIARCEMTLRDADLSAPISGAEVSEATGAPDGFSLDWPVSRTLKEKNGIVRTLRFNSSNAGGLELTGFESLKYSIAVPKIDAELLSVQSFKDLPYTVMTFSLYGDIIVFEYGFAILLALQGISLLGDIIKIRRSIRRSLMPIYELTLAAQSVSKSANPVMALPDVQELQLSGTIDTLNTITENDLDRRIMISDERQELRGLAEAINAMLDRLDAAYRSQLRFVSDASHELRTPIAVIQGYANLLDRWGKNDEKTLQESIDAIKTEASGMKDLVEQLLFLARSDNRSIALNVENVDIPALVDEVVRETQMIDPSHEFMSRLTLGLTVRGDAHLLKQALRIFVDNAIKYTPKGGRITLSAVEDGDYAKTSVSDNGIGIPEEDLSRVFDRFFRADESRARGTGGTGLGLSIAKWIVDSHGGFVEIVSRVDIGTKITLALPKCKVNPL